jgi:triacylglycerol lipase
MPRHNVVLVPGFFGFSSFGKLSYFYGIKPALERAFERLGHGVNVTEVPTLPTASIRVRAARVQEALAAIASREEGPIHLIGHSTGGLDARLAIAPTASLPSRVRFEKHDRIRTLVTVCCPHFGSPVATFFSGSFGRRVLRILARYLVWVLRRRRVPLALGLRIGHWFVRTWSRLRKRATTFDELYDKLLTDLSPERRAELVQFLEAVSSDEALVFQLTPAGCDLLNACTADPDVRYGSVVARAPQPSFRRYLRGFWDPYAQFLYPAYAFLHRLASHQQARWIPEAVGAQRDRLVRFFGELPSPRDNDGIVPTNSQVWGEVVHAACADHLDVVGHFGTSDSGGYAGDWLPTQSAFDSERFESLWSDVAAFISADIARGPLPPTAENVGTERTEQDLAQQTPTSQPKSGGGRAAG